MVRILPWQIILVLIFFVVQNVNASDLADPNKKDILRFNADISNGVIGSEGSKYFDDPRDNIFKIQIENIPDSTDAWLVYSLYGQEDRMGVLRSINHQLSVGGYLNKKSTRWSDQRERISLKTLRTGENIIQFNSSQANGTFQIKDVAIEFTKADDRQQNIYFDSLYTFRYDSLVHVYGFVTTAVKSLAVESHEVRIENGVFDAVIPIHQTRQPKLLQGWATLRSGEELPFNLPVREIEELHVASLEPNRKVQLLPLVPGNNMHLAIEGATLYIPADAVRQELVISGQPLHLFDLPPLSFELSNITLEASGYRFLPDGQIFDYPLTLNIKYDRQKIPKGYTEKDIHIFFFDLTSKSWKRIKRIAVNEKDLTITGLTTHFTDFIAGIIKVPESPETNGYVPTTLKDIKVSDPATGIELIEPPQANNQGNVNLSFPIKLPPGRNGFNPNLSLQYSSDGSSGWLGLGWSLNIPMITIDTRWGVPRYDPDLETETYSLNGSMLHPVAHRSAPKKRQADKRFRPRIENKFDLIRRNGSSPRNYWWEVTEKNGTKHSYGNESDESAMLTDTLKNIALWYLTESQDANGNSIHYHYKKVNNPQIPGGSNGRNIYLSKITFTGFKEEEGAYEIEFILAEDYRQDVTISARHGFKKVDPVLLDRIEISFRSNLIRTYKFEYRIGSFFKSLLKSITELDAEGVEFNTHILDYYDEVDFKAGNFFDSKTLETERDLNVRLINGIPLFDGHAAAISTSESSNRNLGVSVTVGGLGSFFSKDKTIGGNISIGRSGSNGLISLVDIDGDNLPDKIFKKNDKLFFRRNIKTPEQQQFFGEPIEIGGVRDFSTSTSKSRTLGLEGHPPSSFVGYSNTKTDTKITTYFSDFNGDGLIDIAKNGVAFLNRVDEDKNPSFKIDPEGTLNKISTGTKIDERIFSINEKYIKQLENDYPLHDVIRMWRAPLKGKIRIKSPISVFKDYNSEALVYKKEDGIRYSIQRGNEILTDQRLDPGEKAFLDTLISVNKDDQIYFRLNSIRDGSYDQVLWNPEIFYLDDNQNRLTQMDANEYDLYNFTASKDFILTSDQRVSVPFSGTMVMGGSLTKERLTDDIHLLVIREKEESQDTLWQKEISSLDTINLELNETFGVKAEDNLLFRISALTNINPKKITWRPAIYYKNAQSDIQVIDTAGNPLVTCFPSVQYELYNTHLTQINSNMYEGPWVAPESGTYKFRPFIDVPAQTSIQNDGFFTASVKGKNRLYGKTTGERSRFLDPPIVQAPEFEVANITKGDTLYFEYFFSSLSFANEVLGASLFNATFQIQHPGGDAQVRANSYSRNKPEDCVLGSLFRGWGQFILNGSDEKSTRPINRNDLKVDEQKYRNLRIENVKDKDDLSSDNDPTKDYFVIMIEQADSFTYRGYDEYTYIKYDTMSSSRMGEDDLSLLEEYQAREIVFAPEKITSASADSWSASLSVSFASNQLTLPSTSISNSTSQKDVEVMDMNGDRYPDMLNDSIIQYTNSLGELSESHRSNEGIYRSESNLKGQTLGGGFVVARHGNAQLSKTFTRNDATSQNSNYVPGDASLSVGIQGNFGFGDDKVSSTIIDINGDGLPDRVSSDGKVKLNLGYNFGALEQWNINGIRSGVSNKQGAGLGVNYSNFSIAFGVGLSRDVNKSLVGTQDINGDGLEDILMNENGSVNVRYNKGNSFSEPMPLTSNFDLDKNTSEGESVNGAFTFCIPLFFIRICINPNISFGQGVSRQQTQIMDIDGDSYPDLLESDSEDRITVRRSTIGRTNLLKKVTRPLGSYFTVDYRREGNSFEMPQNQWVMSELEIFDGVKGDGINIQKKKFEYLNGFQNRREREFYGFSQVSTHDIDTGTDSEEIYRTSIVQYHNDNYYRKGIAKNETLLDKDGNKYIEKESHYSLRNVTNGEILSATERAADDGIAFPALDEKTEFFFEGDGNNGLSRTMRYEYDRLGNIVAYEDTGDGTPEDLLSASISYHDIDEKYIKSIPKTIKVNGGTDPIRQRESQIDDHGNVTLIRQRIDGISWANFDMEYDQYGNMIRITRPENNLKQRLTYEYEYDDQVQTYIIGIEDSYGLESTSTYDYRFGEMIGSTDINDQEIRYELDAKGRISKIIGPYELGAGRPYTVSNEFFPDAEIPYSITKNFDPENNGDIETITFIDGLKRPIQIKKTGSIFTGEGQNDQITLIASGRIIFDAFGRKIEEYFPTIDNGNKNSFNATFDNIRPTEFQYDVLDRTISTILPDRDSTETTYNIAPDNEGISRFHTSVKDPLQNIQDAYHDQRERKRATTLHEPNEIWTNYHYNVMSEPILIIDAHGNETRYEYDFLGRKLSMEHPDAGLITSEYDPAGNLLEKITPNIREIIPTDGAIRYKYDFERLVEIIYPRNFQNNVRFHYGTNGAPHNRAGRIWLQEDGSGGQEFFFGPLGETTKNIRTVILNDVEALTFISEYEYDTWNRLQNMVYPDGEVVQYHYNRAGKLQSMLGTKDRHSYPYVSQLGYDKFEQRAFLKYGNNTTTRYLYDDERRWLTSMMVNASGRTIMDNRYQFDPVGNIESIVNEVSAIPGTLGGPSEYHYQYDDLYRLKSAEGSYQGNDHQDFFDLDLTYDNVHNIIGKNQMHQRDTGLVKENTYNHQYQYDGFHPNTPTKVGDELFQYDLNGNMLHKKHETLFTQRQLQWDEEDRLMSLVDDGYRSLYTYDASSERTVKSHGGVQGLFINGLPAGIVRHEDNYTVYVSPYFVARASAFTKHYFIEEQRIVSKLGTGVFNNNSLGGYQIAAGNIDYSQRARLLQQAANRHYKNLGIPPGHPTLPGYYGQPEQSGLSIAIDTLDSSTNVAPPGWPQFINTNGPDDPPGHPTLPRDSINFGNPEAGYGFNGDGYPEEINLYFYHPDHLGSSNYLTDREGSVRQHNEYLPFGETFVDEHVSDDIQPYLYNGKELDEESGLYYYGARYYEPKLSNWLSVDPMTEKYPGWSSYNYTLQNPLKYVDIDGREPMLQFFHRSRIMLDIGLGFGNKRSPIGVSLLNARYSYDILRSDNLNSNPRLSTEVFSQGVLKMSNYSLIGRRMHYDRNNKFGFGSNKFILEKRTGNHSIVDRFNRLTYASDGLGSKTTYSTGVDLNILDFKSKFKYMPLNIKLRIRTEAGINFSNRDNLREINFEPDQVIAPPKLYPIPYSRDMKPK